MFATPETLQTGLSASLEPEVMSVDGGVCAGAVSAVCFEGWHLAGLSSQREEGASLMPERSLPCDCAVLPPDPLCFCSRKVLCCAVWGLAWLLTSASLGYKQGAAKVLIFPVVQQFTEAFVQALQMPDGPTSDSGFKMEVLKVRFFSLAREGAGYQCPARSAGEQSSSLCHLCWCCSC